MSKKPLLIEIGVEEIPAGVAPHMGDALKLAIETLLSDANLQVSELKLGVTPRRLLVHVLECPVMQEDREETIWGPPEKVAFKDGQPTKAAEGFAKKSGLNVADFELADKGDGRGNYMKAVQTVKGRNVADIIAEAMPAILRKLPSPKQMKWNDDNNRDDAFIRPIRWIVARLGDEVIPFSFAGVAAGKTSRGHRVHGKSGEIRVKDPFAWLSKEFVMADRDARKFKIGSQLADAMNAAHVEFIEDRDLLEEVTDLTEWPHVITGRYDEDFLRLPEEVARIELKHHQRCFATQADGKMSNVFFTVANNIKLGEEKTAEAIEAVAHGNERVVNARLADAMFYFERDPQESLEVRVEKLSEVVFQDGLGMVGDQVRRLRGFVLDNAKALGVDANDAQRAAYLCKSDLTTGLVGEFPELQGYMGGIYAEIGGENDAVAKAIATHYAPTGADDDLPDNPIARAIGIAERADKLLGYFHLGRVLTASADPFGLRRAAIGLIRLLENTVIPINMTLTQVLDEAAKQWNQQRVTIAITVETKQSVSNFIYDRWLGMSHFPNALHAAMGTSVERPMYQTAAVESLLFHFTDSETGKAVTAANKRIANILKQAGNISGEISETLFSEDAERALFSSLQTAEARFPDDPEGQLQVLASLREPVDTFFDDVMVMVEDKAVRTNRLALLNRLRTLFLKLADVSRL